MEECREEEVKSRSDGERRTGGREERLEGRRRTPDPQLTAEKNTRGETKEINNGYIKINIR